MINKLNIFVSYSSSSCLQRRNDSKFEWFSVLMVWIELYVACRLYFDCISIYIFNMSSSELNSNANLHTRAEQLGHEESKQYGPSIPSVPSVSSVPSAAAARKCRVCHDTKDIFAQMTKQVQVNNNQTIDVYHNNIQIVYNKNNTNKYVYIYIYIYVYCFL
jgi:hypothetical protein